jgi:sugar-specific transcriptional regulator TrmB
MKNLEFLEITPNEEIAYAGLLKNPRVTAARLANIVSLDKSSTYRAVEGLHKKNLIISAVNEIGTIYTALSPNRLLDLHSLKTTELQQKKDFLNEYITDLQKQSQQTRSTNIQITFGLESHIQAMEDSLINNSNGIILEKWFMDNPIFKNKEYQKYVYGFVKRRVKKKIHVHYLTNSNYKNEFEDIMYTSKKLLKEVRREPADADNIHSFRIYKDTVEVITFDETKEFIIIIINDPFVTEMMKTMFYFIWNRSEVIQKHS